jgi:hypothetical protein
MRMSDQERAARYSDLFEPGAGHEHASECAYCPICATIRVVRNTRPEIVEHLTAATRELIVAVGLFLEEAERIVGTEDGDPERAPKIRRIDID